jgi:hypothetical protein
MDERQKLQSDLKRYRTIRDLISDERVVAAIEEIIREAEDRLVQIKGGLSRSPAAEAGTA